MLTGLLPAASAAIEIQDRAEPPCQHFGPCGGCQLQHLTYPAQLALKAARLRTLLEAASLTFPELQIHASPPLAYRNRIRLTLAEVDGQLRAGYIRGSASPTEPASGFLQINECPIAAPILWRATEAFLGLVNENSAAWLCGHFTPDQLELFTTADESRVQVTLYVRSAAKSLPVRIAAAFDSLCDALRARVPQLIGSGIALLPALPKQLNRRAEQSRPGPAWGSPGLNYTVSATEETGLTTPRVTCWVPRGAFFQINRFLLPKLLAIVCPDRATPGRLAWDLYAGVGLFSRNLARNFALVTAVEIAEPAASALASTKLRNLHAVKSPTLDFLRAAVVQRDRPDLIVLDPPRTGAGDEVCALLSRIAAPTLVYVSCSPEKLPCDLKTLTSSGYTLAELHLLDLFPQTIQIETVAILTCSDRVAATLSASVLQS